MSVLLFLIDTSFFLLVGAALLRGWMNSLRMRMSQQPGIFVMAITDWLIGPLRKTLPRRWMQASIDWGSFMAAILLSLVYSALWHALRQGVLPEVTSLSWMVTIPVVALQLLLRVVLQGFMLLALVYAVFSWVQPMSAMHGTLARLVEPLLRPIRRLVPLIGGVDLSVLVLVVLLQMGLMLIA